MIASGNFTDASLERLHSVCINRVMSPSDAVNLVSPLIRCLPMYVSLPYIAIIIFRGTCYFVKSTLSDFQNLYLP